jgi:hypothetical protein
MKEFNISFWTTILLLTFSLLTNAQVELTEVLSDEKKSFQHTETRFYLSANWSNTTRKLLQNGDLFGDSLGERTNEVPLNTWSFGLGVRSDFAKQFFWDGGLSFLRNGEQYSYEDPATDSTFNYQTTYSYISMPLKLNAFIGKKVRLYFGGGLVPQMFFRYRQNQQWTSAENTAKSDEIKSKSGYSSFVISGLLNLGVEFVFESKWSLFVASEARWQLSSTYMPQDSYTHKAQVYGASFGIMRDL